MKDNLNEFATLVNYKGEVVFTAKDIEWSKNDLFYDITNRREDHKPLDSLIGIVTSEKNDSVTRISLGIDPRGYNFWLLSNYDGIVIEAGCRYFDNFERAKMHWSDNADAMMRVEKAEEIVKYLKWFDDEEEEEEETIPLLQKDGSVTEVRRDMVMTAVETIQNDPELMAQSQEIFNKLMEGCPETHESQIAVKLEAGEEVPGFSLVDTFEISKELDLPVPVIEEV